jgi:hypothetical protein
MSLSCSCNYEAEPGDTCWEELGSYMQRPVSMRAPRCACCGVLIRPLALCLKFRRFKIPETELEEIVYGEEIPRAYHYLCEYCGDQWFNLTELGFCFDYRETLDALAEYRMLQDESIRN